MRRLLLALFLLVASASAAFAQQSPGQICFTTNGTNCVPIGTTNPLPVTGDTEVSTYSAAVVGQSNSSSGDLACIKGSSTKSVHIKKIRVSAVASAGVVLDVSIIKRSTNDSGGTPTILTNVPLSSKNNAATAVVTAYATAPTEGISVGNIRSQKLAVATTNSPATAQTPLLFNFADYFAQDVALYGINENLCIRVANTAGGSWDLDMEWTEP